MKLKEFVDKYKIDPVVFSLECGLRPATIWAYLRGDRRPSQKAAEEIEKVSDGLVTVFELRGEDKRGKATSNN